MTPLPVTFAQARLQGWEIWSHCKDCRMWRLMKLADMVVSPHDETPIEKLTQARKFYCHECKGKRVLIHVKRDRVGRSEVVAEFEQG